MTCDGTNFDINGQSVDGAAYFLAGAPEPLTCTAMVNICSSANGSPASGCATTEAEPSDTHEFECDTGPVHEIEIPAATMDCQDAVRFFAETFTCNRTDDFETALADYEACYPRKGT